MLTILESGLLVTLGALLAWLAGVSASRAQWRREKRRRIADQRAEIYKDTLVYMDRIRRVRYRNELEGRHGARPAELPDGQAEEERAEWSARIELYASRDVQDLWEKWTFAVASDATDAHEARTALIERMRAEVRLS